MAAPLARNMPPQARRNFRREKGRCFGCSCCAMSAIPTPMFYMYLNRYAVQRSTVLWIGERAYGVYRHEGAGSSVGRGFRTAVVTARGDGMCLFLTILLRVTGGVASGSFADGSFK